MKQLIIWNQSDYTDVLATFFPREDIITDSAQYCEALKKKDYHSIVVLCELNWTYNNKAVKMQHFHGIELVKEMRRTYSIDIPVLFVSFYPLQQLFNAQTEILTAIGHGFCQLPVSPQVFIRKLANEKKISPIELKDIQLFSCTPRGIIMVKTHQIRGVAIEINELPPGVIRAKLERCIEDIHTAVQADASHALNRFRRDFPTVDHSNIDKVLAYIDATGKELTDTYIITDTGTTAAYSMERPWKLLLLDDELNEGSGLVKLLAKKGVKVICTSNAADATKALMQDNSLRGKIALILSDFRLIDHKDGIAWQQKKQGYAFLQDVAEKFQNRLLSSVVYSGMPRQFLLETFRTFRIRTEIYSKIDFKVDDEGANNFLANRLIEIGDENYEALSMLPLSSRGWEDHLHDTYLLYRRQLDYDKRERDICDYCTEWVTQFRKGENPPTPMIPGDAFNVKKNEQEKDTLARFEAYYKTRRLAQYLHLYYESLGSRDRSGKSGDPADKIPEILVPPNKKMKTPGSRRGFFSQIIGFKREEFPLGATIEELCWFEYDLGITVLDSYRLFRNKLDTCENEIGTFIQETKSLRAELSEAGYTYVDERKHELRFDANTCNPYLFDRTDLTLCLEWVNKHNRHFNQSTFQSFLSLLENTIKPIWNEPAYKDVSMKNTADCSSVLL